MINTFAKQQKETEMVAQYKLGYELYQETEEKLAWIAAPQKDAFPANYRDDEYASWEYAQ